ncbi:replication protein RepA [Rhizobium sp. LjRoot30]|uniref:replication protein RepA n=1 Tax=Rhizobium sp. LjRoot30 TaxID=3342320 RepID=UPI003ED09297
MTTPAIHDADLLDELTAMQAKSTNAQILSMFVRDLERRQAKRDAETTQAQARQAELALMTPMEKRRAVVREVIESEGPSPANLRYMHSSLAICGLPYKKLPEGEYEFERKQGRMAVVVQAGKLRAPDGQRVQQPVPYGPKPRLILAHLSTEAIRNKSATIDVAETLTAFMRELGFEKRGGERGNIKPFKEQLQALAACRMEISAWDGKRSATIDAKPFKGIELWMSDNPDQKSLWPSTVTFSQEFYQSLREHALPIDVRALHAFANSAKKLDLLFWLNYRLHSMKAQLVLDWKPLQAQFGDGYARERDFRAGLAADIEHIKSVFPKLPVKLTERGLVLENADPTVLSIPKRLAKK